jgi:hypothetical protein
VAWAKNVWGRYVTRCSHVYLRGVTVQTSDGRVPRYCEHIGANVNHHLLESGPVDFESRIDWMIRTTKKKTHETISQMWKWLCQAYSTLVRQPMDCLTTERVRRVRLVPFIDPHYMIVPADFSIVYQRRYLDAETAHRALCRKILASEMVVFVLER